MGGIRRVSWRILSASGRSTIGGSRWWMGGSWVGSIMGRGVGFISCLVITIGSWRSRWEEEGVEVEESGQGKEILIFKVWDFNVSSTTLLTENRVSSSSTHFKATLRLNRSTRHLTKLQIVVTTPSTRHRTINLKKALLLAAPAVASTRVHRITPMAPIPTIFRIAQRTSSTPRRLSRQSIRTHLRISSNQLNHRFRTISHHQHRLVEINNWITTLSIMPISRRNNARPWKFSSVIWKS